MRLLLDTHVLLWAMMDPRRLPVKLESAIRSSANDVAVSAVSVWEISIKRMLGRLELEIEALLQSIAEANFTELPLKFGPSTRLLTLPPHHRDPFDRMLIAQAIHEGRRLVTTDGKILQYRGASGFDPLTA